MNILFVHAIGKNKFGGGEKWVIMAGCGLRDLGHRVWVGGRSGSRLLAMAREHGLETVPMNVLSDLSLWHCMKIARFIRRNGIDTIIARERELGVAGLAAKMAAGVTRAGAPAVKGGKPDAVKDEAPVKMVVKPVVLSRHGLPLRSSIRKHVWLLKCFADGLITNAKSTREIYEHNNWFRKDFIHLLYNGVNPPGATNEYDFSARFPGKKIILSVGRLARQKGFCHLIDAMARLRGRHDDLQLVILGEGKMKRQLKALARKKKVADRVHFQGFVQDVSPYLAGADLFVLPSLYEGMPNAAMEAMAHGKPVVITGVDGASELVPDPGKGRLVPPKNPEAICEAIRTYLENPELRATTGQNAREYVLQHFSARRMTEELHQLILEKHELKNGPDAG